MVRLTQSAGCWCSRIPVFLLGAGMFTVLLGIAQEPVITPNRAVRGHVERREAAPSLRMDVNRVFIPVTITDAYGRKVEGLGKDDFRIFEDGVQQTVSEFFVDDSPVSVGIVLDASHSMADKIDASRKAMISFIKLSAPEDEFFLVTVQDQPELVHTFTRDADEIQHEMEGVRTQGWTALYDGMYLGVNHARHGHQDNRALVVLSDGGDNNSRYTESEIKNLVRESDIRVFSISVMGRSPSLEKIAEASGGRAFHIHKLAELPDIATQLSDVIHGEYVVGFSPAARVRDGKYHAIRVEVAQPPGGNRLHASWRHGYFAPYQ